MIPIFGLIAFDESGAQFEPDPIVCDDGTLVVAAARLDNRDDLVAQLGEGSDEQLVARAWAKWRRETPRHLFGDWAFAAWDVRERTLFVARDHYGYTPLYYWRDARRFAFASERKRLFELVRPELNEEHLTRYLANDVDPGVTFHKGIFRVPPAHRLTVMPGAFRIERYWRMEDAPDVRLPSDDAYVERFLELYVAAIRARLRSTRPIAATLSSGLDSGSVTAIAARELNSLTAFTAVPLVADVSDEWPLAHATAAWCGNVEHVAVRAERMTAIAAIDRSLEVHGEPVFMARHLPWALGIAEACRERGFGALLIAQMGNGGGSWAGERADRMKLLLPKLHPFGTFWGEIGAGYGIEVRDPTADIRLLEFCLGIPETLFAGRRLMRRAVEGLLPPAVQRNEVHGRQGADLPFRLLADRANVEDALREMSVDAAPMRRQWQSLQAQPDFMLAADFYRSLLVGRFVTRAFR